LNLDTGVEVNMTHSSAISKLISYQGMQLNPVFIPTLLVFVSDVVLSTNGTYKINARYTDFDQGALHVQSSLFKIIDEPLTKVYSQVYLVNGPQKSESRNFRQMGTYNEEGYSLATILSAQFYDSRFDSLFMVKAYFTDQSKQPYAGY
jgi:hypothetical protein